MSELAKHRPHMATVLDLEREDQLPEVLSWAEEAAQFVEIVCIIPKAYGVIARLPHRIGKADIRLAYSVPTRYGGTDVPTWEFDGWPVHLLGGSPNAAMRVADYLDVHSTDGNYHLLKASRYCEFWQDGKWHELQDPGGHVARDAIYEAFRRSCENITAAWHRKEIRQT